jgi:hypothetical protein
MAKALDEGFLEKPTSSNSLEMLMKDVRAAIEGGESDE